MLFELRVQFDKWFDFFQASRLVEHDEIEWDSVCLFDSEVPPHFLQLRC